MPTDRQRLAARQGQPVFVRLARALGRLTSTLTFMNTGAHPDDEHSDLLALLRFGFGMRTIIACSTRGEGGQNALGPERGGVLGVLRTRELEAAARALDADVVWLGHGPDDPVHDFGFSKSGEDTLRRWGEARIVERLVRAYRAERPDIVLPTFLDVPGQHGHHRAMTLAAERAVALAADPAAFPEHLGEGLAPWLVAKFYLPAWSGGGGTYDDELPPPPATLTVAAPGRDPVSGAGYGMLGEMSRAFHASQGMGFWRVPGEERWPLHLKLGPEGAETDLRDNLPATLGRIAALAGGAAGERLAAADGAIAGAVSAFPDGAAVAAQLAEARRALAAALAAFDAPELRHRLVRKQAEIDAAMAVAAGIVATAWIDPPVLVPGRGNSVHVVLEPGAGSDSSVDLALGAGLSAGEPVSEAAGVAVPVAVDAGLVPRNAFHPGYSSLGGNGLVSVALSASVAGETINWHVDLEEPAELAPPHAVALEREALIVPLPAKGATQAIEVRTDAPEGSVTIDGGDGVVVRPRPRGFDVTFGAGLAAGRQSLPVRLDGAQAFNVTSVAYPHVGRFHYLRPQMLDVLALDLALPAARVGYVGGGADRVGLWLERMGADVTDLDAAALAGDLGAFDTIVVGIFAFGTRPDLAAAVERLHRFVENGGHLVTLYHRPSDGWQPERTPPRRLVIGSPSLRWRVTDPAAPVRILAPEHWLLAGPNRIGPADFEGWNKERGLYFAAEWDAAYKPLLAMSDAGEKPLEGSLITAEMGSGRHTHASLVLHHQLDHLVPGAFRLLANLIQPA